MNFNSKVKVCLLFSLLVGFIIAATSPVLASGNLTTTNTNQPGQVQTVANDDVLYLTTDINPSNSPVIQERNSYIQLPRGFANDFIEFINRSLRIVLAICALLVFGQLILGAFDWITSGGDKGKTDKARDKMFAAVVGLIIVAASYAILTLVLRFINAGDLNTVINRATGLGASETELGRLNEASPSGVTK